MLSCIILLLMSLASPCLILLRALYCIALCFQALVSHLVLPCLDKLSLVYITGCCTVISTATRVSAYIHVLQDDVGFLCQDASDIGGVVGEMC